MDKPVYRRTASRRESFRIDIDADEVKKVLSSVLGEDIPETAAFHIDNDGGITFCWDIDVDLVEPVEPAKPTQNGIEYEGPSQGPGDHVIAVEPGLPDDDGPGLPADQVVSVEAASLDLDGPAEPYEDHVDLNRDRERLVNIATGRARVREPVDAVREAIVTRLETSQVTGTTPYEKNLARHSRKIDTSNAQCDGVFREGTTRVFRCHLDHGHEGDCGPAEGCEPEDPPKGRRRSW